jgi:(1->4)-alpha-D-glucan 1-alpha-D-glucosylmutase
MMQIPLATYRVQFNADFTFDHLKAIAPYLSELGITDIYASPILTARTGSNHGYDAVNPSEINPVLGGMEGFNQLIGELKKYDMGWIQDIVPNHMAYSNQNRMLVDVLENGPDSQFRDFFDINWQHPSERMQGRVLAPFLGKFYGDCLESGELQLKYDEDGLSINYYDLRFPLRIESYSQVLTYDLARLRHQIGRDHPCFLKLLGVLYAIKNIPSGAEGMERYDQITFIKRLLWELWEGCEEVQQFLTENIQTFNGEVGNSESYNLLDALHSEQCFRLSYWKVGNEELNYRRFFTVNDLISLRVEDEQVFEQVHSFVLQLIEDKRVTGLRIDHIDGLYDPGQYLQRLRDRIPDTYIVVEKILETHEELPLQWSIQGTSGYDFLNWVNGIQCQTENKPNFSRLYTSFLDGELLSCDKLIDHNKRQMIGKHLAGDIDNLAHLLKQIAARHRYASDFTMYGLKRALVEVLTQFPVYRTYINSEGASKADQICIQNVIEAVREQQPGLLNELFFLEKFLVLEFHDSLSAEDEQQWLHFLMRLQQFTGPLMAKGVEDTVFYIYNRLASLNEVGCDPRHFGLSLADPHPTEAAQPFNDFHGFNQIRFAKSPHAMNATATHDTKRGEDVRARLNVLSEIPEEWETQLKLWRQLNAEKKTAIAQKREMPDKQAPTLNDEYLFYQTILGAFPFEKYEYEPFVERVKEYMIKAMREAKVNTEWLRPETDYENAVLNFVDAVMNDSGKGSFLETFRPFQQKVQHYGICNSLMQTLLKMTAPGLPDFYQGTELWDLSLVDPDNRRPVDFEHRREFLQKIKTRCKRNNLSSFLTELLSAPADGRLKLFLIYRVLQARRDNLTLFQKGGYQKFTVVGSLKSHVVTFAREWEGKWAIAIAPRFPATLTKVGEYPLGEQVWQETRITLPAGFPTTWQDAISGQKIKVEDGTLWIKASLSQFPVALLMG